jgi:uncharacterized membrane protein
MTTPAPDLSRLRINRDAPAAPLRRALWLNVTLVLVAVVLVVALLWYLRRDKAASAVVMGVVGGFFPARRASKVPVVEAIR